MALLLHKEELRKQMLEKRKQITAEQRQQWSRSIAEKVIAAEEFTAVATIMLYSPLPGEVETEEIMAAATAAGKTVLLPRVEGNHVMAHIIAADDVLVPGPYGVMQPAAENEPMPAIDIELVLVPGLAFDQSGNRLGYGKGYYDRFLKTTAAEKMAVAFDFQLLQSIPGREHDEKMNIIITEKRRIEC